MRRERGGAGLPPRKDFTTEVTENRGRQELYVNKLITPFPPAQEGVLFSVVSVRSVVNVAFTAPRETRNEKHRAAEPPRDPSHRRGSQAQRGESKRPFLCVSVPLR
jgi:hypothetical protein